MGAFAAGQVVLLPFPFSDLSRSKFRPALLLADAGRGDWIACQITSNPFADTRAGEITDADFAVGGLQRLSYARPGKLLTAHQGLFAGNAGAVQTERLAAGRDAVVHLITGHGQSG
ncbi:MAG TPA: MazF family transcriptional regulator [bacterium]